MVWQAEPDPDRRVRRLSAGQADLVSKVPPALRETLSQSSSTRVVEAESTVCVVFMCNAFSGPCAGKRVRQALNYALDVPKIIKEVKGGAAYPLSGPLTPLHLGYNPSVQPYPHDPTRARQLLSEAGYGGGLRLTLDVPTTIPDEAPVLAKAMALQMEEVGIEVEINTVPDRPGYAEMVKAKKVHDACCFDSSPPSTYRVLREKFHSGLRGAWWLGYSNPHVDSLLNEAQATPELERRREIYRRVYRMVHDDAPWIFLYNPVMLCGVGPRAHPRMVGLNGWVRPVL